LTLGAATGVSAGSYVIGLTSTVVVVAVLAWGAWWLRAALLPTWSGANARLAEIVIAIGALIGIAQLLGTFGAFEPLPMLIAYVGTGLVMGLIGGRLTPRHGLTSSVPRRSPRVEVIAAAIAGALVAAQWVMHVAVTYGRGITQPDSLWYHATFAARFVESGRLTELNDTGLSDLATPLHTFLPLNGSLVQGIAMLPFHNDLLSPILNLAWAGLAVLAAWCLGRRHGLGALLVLAAILLLGVPTLAGTQPGQAANDVATMALFLAAVALLFEGELAPAPTALAGIAAGLALGTKLTVAAPLAALTIGVVVVAFRARRRSAAVWWCTALALFGGYWFVRNWVIFGNPVPWMSIDLGPITLSAEIRSRPPLADFLGDWAPWREFIFPGLSKALGPGWIPILGLALTGAALGVARGRQLLERFAGAAVPLGMLTVFYIQFGGAFGGGGFVFMVRYFAPVLMLGFALLAFTVARGPLVWRRAFLLIMVVLVVLGASAEHIEGVEAWPAHEWLPGLLAGVGVLAAVAVLALPRTLPRTTALVAAGVVLGATMLGGGWLLQQHYFDRRYVRAGLPHDGINAMFQSFRDEKVAVYGTEHFYPFFGADLSNRVSRRFGPFNGPQVEKCRAWRRLLAADEYRYVVVAHDQFAGGIPDESWVSGDPAATPVLRRGNTTVYRINGRIDPKGCA
jgi:hypothetical protein